MLILNLLMHCFLKLSCPGLYGSTWLFMSWGTVASHYLCFLQHGPVCSGLRCPILVPLTDFNTEKKFLYGFALLTNIYHQIPATDDNDSLFSNMKKLGIDLSSLVSSLWEFMLAMVSTMLFLPAQNTLLLATTGFLLKHHEQMSYVWPVSKFFGNTVRYRRHRSWDLFSLLNYCSVHTL